MAIEVVTVIAERLSQTVAVVEHRGYTIEAETIEVVFAEPVLAVAQEEVHHLILTIVEAETVPSWMLMSVARIEVLVRITGKIAETFHLVLHCMRVNDIHNDSYAILMGCINERLEFLWGSETAAGSKEAANVVTEGSVVRMLLDSHDLNAVVTILYDTWQHIFLEFRVGAHLLGILSHAYVALVDEQRSGVRPEGLLLPLVRLRVPYLRRENLGLLILNHTVSPCRDTLAFSTFPVHLHFEEITVLHCLFREFQLPVAGTLDTLSTILRAFLPAVEISDEIDICSIWRPLAEHPSLLRLMQSEVVVSVGEIAERNLAVTGKLVELPERMLMSSYDSRLKVCQIWIVLHESDMFWGSSLHGFLGSALGGCLAGSLLGCCLLCCSIFS